MSICDVYGGAIPPTCSTIGVQRSNAVRRKRSMCSFPEARSEEESVFLANSELVLERSLNGKPLFKRPLRLDTQRRGSICSVRPSPKSQAGHKRAYSSPVSTDQRRWARYLEIANSSPKTEEDWLELGARLAEDHRKPPESKEVREDCQKMPQPEPSLESDPRYAAAKAKLDAMRASASKKPAKKMLSGLPRLKACRKKLGTADLRVGGKFDCWKAVFQCAPNEDEPMKLVDFAHALIEAIEWRLGENCHKIPQFDSDMCYICMETPCECSDAEAPAIVTTPFQDALQDYKLHFSTDSGNLHLIGYRWKSASSANTVGYCTLAEFLEFTWLLMGEGIVPSGSYPPFEEIMRDPKDVRQILVGLTTAVVLGTIGDVEPTLDVVAANHFASVTQEAEPSPYQDKFIFTESGSGWCATDFLTECPGFARALDDKFGSAKGNLRVSHAVWNDICKVWGGTVVADPCFKISGAFPEEVVSDFLDVPERMPGPHERVFPEDFVLVTHHDHIKRLAEMSPQGVVYETRDIPVSSHDFIKLGQDILQGGVFAFKDMEAMQKELIRALKVTLPIVEQSDLVYLVSGTTYHYFIGSLFPDKQVYEVCPVPREDNGVCPEFYLGHYAKFFSAKPSFSHELGRAYNQWLMAPRSLRELEWEGEFKYREPPKFHSITPWAREKWQIQSANVGFKPYDDFRWKTSFVENDKIHAYVSFGSCEHLTQDTLNAITWLRGLNVKWACDPRWFKYFEGCDAYSVGFFSHTTGLADFDWVVHHGGSGTTNTCLAVGVPQTILPQIGDQFIWEEALTKHTIKLGLSEDLLRAYLFSERKVEYAQDFTPLLQPDQLALLQRIGAKPVVPFRWYNRCCHDFDALGYKETDLVVADIGEAWATLFNVHWEKHATTNIKLKWVNKACTPMQPTLPGRQGVSARSTYPWHAHGWLEVQPGTGWNLAKGETCDPDFWRALGNTALTRRTVDNPFMPVYPKEGLCDWCPIKGELSFGLCHRCLIKVYKTDSAARKQFESERRLERKQIGVKPLVRKPPRFRVTQSTGTLGHTVRSTRRYFQLDSRMLNSAPNYRVARALMDRVKDWTDVKWVEAFWAYTNSWPPHYKPRTDYEVAINEVASMHASVELTGLATDIVNALGKVLSVSSGRSILNRVLGVNILTTAGRKVMHRKWHVLVDGLRHFAELGAKLDIKVMPDLISSSFPALPTADCTSLVHFRRGLAKPLRTRVASNRWLEEVHSSGSDLMVHLFSLKLPALGSSFGVFHAVVEYKGTYFELQQVAGELTFINETKWQPEATPDRPLVKTIVVSSPVVGTLDTRAIHREFSGIDYKTLGDNCLVFANFLVYNLTGKVIPWRHFGAFGQDIPLEVGTLVRKWAVSYLWTDEQEKRVSIDTMTFSCPNLFFKPSAVAARARDFTGPKPNVKDYGLDALRRVDATISAFDRQEAEDCPWSEDMLLNLALLGYKRYGLTSHLVSQALLKIRMSNIPQRKRRVDLIMALGTALRKLHSTRLVGDIKDVLTVTSQIRMPLRSTRKPAWAPLVNISVPRHWFKDKERLVEVRHDPENLTVGNKKIVRLDLPQIVKRYEHYFKGVEFPDMGFKFVRPGEYEIGVKVPLRKNLPKMDSLTQALVNDLQEMHPFELGVFSLRFGTEEMAEKVTDRYFTGAFESGQLIPEHEQKELAEAIFQNNKERYANAQLLNPEEVWKKWHKNYSAGFPFRFNARGNAKRQALIDAAGGKEKFLGAIRDYIASPEAFPTVSHAFIKDEVLPKSYIEREKIRTIIAQDPLNYYSEMAVNGYHAKQMDPTSFSAVGVSPAHGELSALAEKHLAYKHHFAMDVTALDSTAAVDAIDTIKKLRCLGYQNHPQRENIESLIDATYTNLQTSWIIDIHTGRARLKRQGFTTGHGTTTGDNTDYMHVMMLYAWGKITGRPYAEFYDEVKFSSFSDDNFWSTNLDKSVFSAKLISDFWLERGVQVRVEGESDDLSNLSFLAKRFSFDPVHLEEVRHYAQRDAKVAIVHDVNRLLQKFSDYKKKNTLGYRWEKLVALQSNCAHHRDIYDKVSEYLDALERNMTRRQFMRKFMRQHPRKSYEDIMRLMYSPGKNKSGLIVSSIEDSLVHRVQMWWDTLRVDIMAFDGTANTYARVLQQFTGLLEIGGLNVEDPGTFLKEPGVMVRDPEFTLEHHCYLLNGCPSSFEQFRFLVQKTPFASFCDIEAFWATRERFDISEETANGLRAKVLLLQGIYTVVAWLERFLGTVPIIGPMYKVFCTAKGMSEQMYSRLNALYWAMFGESSLILSSMMPKDRYLSLKRISFGIWTRFTGTDLLDFAGDLDQFKDLADSMARLAQDVNNLVFDMDISSLVPRPDTGEGSNTGRETGWVALDHSHSVNECLDHIRDRREPLVTGPTGCGKSTDFVIGLSQVYGTVLVACPRRILVKGSPIAQKRLYSGCQDKLTPGQINFGTSGYFRRTLGTLPQDTILVLDEFHELDEDTLWLHEHFAGNVICISATPEFPGSERFSQVRLTKSRTSGFTVTTQILDTRGNLEDVWRELTKDPGDKRRTLCIVPTLRMVHELTRHAVKLAPSKRVCELYRGHDLVVEADWYFATSLVDSGITVPDLEHVIDAGWSSGWSSGSFSTQPSSHNTMDQRKGRTGRTCDGFYTRLITQFDDTPWDFTTPFLFNNWEVVAKWAPGLERPKNRKRGCLEELPAGYDSLLVDGNWSALIYLVFFYANRGDVNRTRADYQAARKFPDRPDVQFLVGPIQNQSFQDLHVVESFLRKYRIPNTEGNVWTPLGTAIRVEIFSEPIPRELQDRDF